MDSAADLDGLPRVNNARVDIGAYETQVSTGAVPFQWMERFGLATDGSADFVDADGDGLNNWQEWRSSTDPTNAASLLEMLASGAEPQPGAGRVVVWSAETGVLYRIEQAADLPGGFVTNVARFIPGEWPVSVYTDWTGAADGGPWFYRVGVE